MALSKMSRNVYNDFIIELKEKVDVLDNDISRELMRGSVDFMKISIIRNSRDSLAAQIASMEEHRNHINEIEGQMAPLW